MCIDLTEYVKVFRGISLNPGPDPHSADREMSDSGTFHRTVTASATVVGGCRRASKETVGGCALVSQMAPDLRFSISNLLSDSIRQPLSGSTSNRCHGLPTVTSCFQGLFPLTFTNAEAATEDGECALILLKGFH